MDSIMELTRAIREIRTEYKVDSKKVLHAKIFVRNTRENLSQNILYLQTLTLTQATEISAESCTPSDMLIASPHYLVYLDGNEIVDKQAECQRLDREIEKATEELQKLQKIMSNQGFVAHAPSAVVEKYNKQIAEFEDKLAQLKQSRQKLG